MRDCQVIKPEEVGMTIQVAVYGHYGGGGSRRFHTVGSIDKMVEDQEEAKTASGVVILT